MGTLYVVSTPIGNLEDVTLRALRVLRAATLIAAEDTRYAMRMLGRYDVHVPCISYHEHNKLSRLDEILAALAQGDVALISDAGTPALSDPGFELVFACINAGFTVSPIPGPSAPIAALVASGLPTDRFLFVGFLPRRSTERRALLADLATITVTLICFEAPHRLIDALSDAMEVLGDRQIAVANDLTKLHEEFLRGRISEVIAQYSDRRPRGEFTLVIEGRPILTDNKRLRQRVQLAPEEGSDTPPSEAEIVRRLQALREQGKSGSAAARIVARDLHVQKSIVYQIWLSMTHDDA
ncbi:MAG: 16S rRNA (cytidine(1402)-2'-O)-methyltransferase [Chloroflexales bacterium]|nr:16S rRNA (cytidine(1402)-2'-O)-methyltransferase [Chloroflexales bacterium]